MFLGHYGVALAVKKVAPEESLGSTVLGAQWSDLLWPILLLAGVEHVRVAPGIMAANSLVFTDYPITHSLLTVLGWGVLLGLIYLAFTRRVRGALVMGILVVSHWFLDLPMHAPDLPLWPGSSVKVGGGLWNSLPVTLLMEFGIFGFGLVLYLQKTRSTNRVGRWGLWSMVAVLTLFYLSSFFGPPPSEQALAYGGLFLWLFVFWGRWVDRHRTVRVMGGSGHQEE